MIDFNKHLRVIRKEKNLTQKQVATGINISERNYHSFEYGETKPSFDVLIAIGKYFNVSIDYLVGRSDNPNINK